MAKRKSPNTSSPPEPPVKHGACKECGEVGQIGRQLVTYSFAKGDWRLLCWAGTGRDCMVKAWEKFVAAQA